jgi:hypothetical protein
MPRKTSELHFYTNRAVTEYMRDNGVTDRETRKVYAESALFRCCRNWSDGTTGYSITHDGTKYIVRISYNS